MKISFDALKEIKALALAEDERICNALDVLRDLATDGAITWEEVERVETAAQPRRDEAAAICKAAEHAMHIRMHANKAALPFIKAPAPLSDKERELIVNKYNAIYGC